MAGPFLFWLYRENCYSLHFDYPTRTEVDKGQAFVIRTKYSYQLFLRLRRRPHSSRRDNWKFITKSNSLFPITKHLQFQNFLDKINKIWYYEGATQFYIFEMAYVGKNVGFACHIHLDVKLCSNNERNCVFRCVVSATHFLFWRRT